MKTFVFVFCALLSVTIVYGSDPAKIAEFHKNKDECAKKMNIPNEPISADLLACIGRREGTIKHNRPIKDKIIKQLEQVISDQDDLEEAKRILISCFNKEWNGKYIAKKKLNRFLQCALPIMDVIDSP